MRKALLFGGVVLLIASLTACSDGLSTGADDLLSDRIPYTVYGITYLELPFYPWWIDHGANVGLRSMFQAPGNYIYEDISDEQTGYYDFPLEDLDDGYYVVDGWYETATKEWFGTSTQFEWDSGNPTSFNRNVWMYEQ